MASPPTHPQEQTGARPVGGEPPPQRRRRRGALWLLLGLLLLAAIVALVLALTLGGKDDSKGSQAGKQSSPSGGASNNSGGGTAAGSGSSATSGSGAGSGRLTAGAAKMLPVPSGGLERFVGKRARGRDVIVLSRIRDRKERKQLDGFWVGSSKKDRVYVEWGGGVGPDEAKFLPKVGQHVNLSGPVRPAPRNPQKTLNLGPSAAHAVSRQGAYINADTVTPAG